MLLVGMCYGEDSAYAFQPLEGEVRAGGLSFSLKYGLLISQYDDAMSSQD
jgi:hypothetical protein